MKYNAYSFYDSANLTYLPAELQVLHDMAIEQNCVVDVFITKIYQSVFIYFPKDITKELYEMMLRIGFIGDSKILFVWEKDNK